MTRRLAFILLLTLVVAAPAFAGGGKDTFKVAPNVAFTTIDGKTIHLADLHGKVVLVDFWASWCVPCRKSFPEIEGLHKEFAAKGLVVLAVTVDEERKNADAFLEMFQHTMTIVTDPHGSVAEAFKVSAMPSTMIVDRAGNLRYTHKGYTDKVLANYRAQVVALLAEEAGQ